MSKKKIKDVIKDVLHPHALEGHEVDQDSENSEQELGDGSEPAPKMKPADEEKPSADKHHHKKFDKFKRGK
jgi:hypothetical protein